MSVHQQVALAQLDTQAFALMSRLHVILRREGARITDIEYMRSNPAYCQHVLDLAEQVPNDALPEICTKLREIFFGPAGLFVMKPPQPLLGPRPAPARPPATTFAPSEQLAPNPGTPDAPAPVAYVGRLR